LQAAEAFRCSQIFENTLKYLKISGDVSMYLKISAGIISQDVCGYLKMLEDI